MKRLHRLSHSPPSLCTGRHLTFPRPPRCAPSPFQVKGLIIENTFTSVEDMVGQVWGREGGEGCQATAQCRVWTFHVCVRGGTGACWVACLLLQGEGARALAPHGGDGG